MCGISVVVAPSASPEVVRDVLRMHGPIRHRGPDGERVLLIDGDSASPFDAVSQVPLSGRASVAAAFRRLKIIDLTDAAAQPMPSRDRKRWLLFNGEIYNFRELRAELGKRGRSFASTGDAEVALQAYEEWGEQCFGRFEGMWAIVLIDLAARKLIASRDRFGIKPLYYTATRERLLLSSEIRQILAVPSHKPAANPRLLASFLRGDRETVYEETFFEGVRSVPPGCWFELPLAFDRAPQPRFRAYWNLSDCTANGAHPSYEHAVEKTSELMKASVESHRIADVRIGSLLSGGLDSSFIATLLARGAPGGPSTVPTFSFGFRQAAPEYCELRYVDEVVRAERMTNYQSTFDASWVAANAAKVVDALEEPPLAVPAFAQYRMFELCREHDTTVVLDGQGSDEIFAGYPFYHRLLLLDYVRQARIPSFLHEAKAIARLASMSTPALLRRSFIHPALYRLLQQVRGAYDWIAPGYGRNGHREEADDAVADSIVNRRLHHDVKWGNVKIILAYADKNAMRFSIEARVPYFDRRLVEFAFQLPPDFKIGKATRKRVLRDAARSVLPPSITDRRDRMGFAVPDGIWMKGELWPAVREAVDRPEFLAQPCFESRRAGRLLRSFESGENRDYRAVWRLWMLAIWQNGFSVSI